MQALAQVGASPLKTPKINDRELVSVLKKIDEHDIIFGDLMSCKNIYDAILKNVKVTMTLRASKGPHLRTYSV